MNSSEKINETKEGESSATEDEAVQEFRIYKKRWFVMINLMLLNLSISMIWLGCSPVAYKVSRYYGTNVTAMNWLSMIFLVVSIPCGLCCSWIMNKCGLRSCLLFSAWISLIGAGTRICSTIESLPQEAKLTLLFLGQMIAAIGQPFSLYASPKVSAVWFPPHQRTISNTLSGMSTPIGVVFSGMISPLFVNDEGFINMRMMLIAYTALPVVCAFMTTVVMTSDAPPSPPSYGSTVTTSDNFFDGVKKNLCHNRAYPFLMVSVGTSIGLYSAFATLLEQVLCPWGYTDKMSGFCSSMLTVAGLVGAIIMSLIVDKTKRFSECLKFMFISAASATIIFALTHRIYMGYFIALEMAILGLLSFGISPIGTETGAEITFPIGVSISTGLIQLSAQIQSIALILLLQSLGRPMSPEEMRNNTMSTCHSKTENATLINGTPVITYDLTVSTYVIAGIITLNAIVFVLSFHPVYKRRIAEQSAISTTLDESIIPEDYITDNPKPIERCIHPDTESPTNTDFEC